ncbi:MAG: HEAT repeat domain-containing protein [Cyanobacteria bacterium P01_F01_bin.150]
MSDNLLTHARNAFERHDWATLILDIRKFLGKVKSKRANPSVQANGAKKSFDDCLVSDRMAIIQLAVQAMPWVDFQTRWELVSLIKRFGPDSIAPLITLLNQFKAENLSSSAQEAEQGEAENGDRSNISSSNLSSFEANTSPSILSVPNNDEDDEDWDLLWFIARILGNIQHPDAITALIQILQTSPSEDVVTAAVMGLAQQGKGAIAPLSKLLHYDATKLVATQALARIFAEEPNMALRDILMTITQDVNASVRAVVIEALSHAHQSQVTDLLVIASDDVAAIVRRAAVTGLGIQAKVCDASIIPTILKSLEPRLWDLDMEVRRQTAIALGRIQMVESATLLCSALTAEDFPTVIKPDVIRSLIWTNTEEGLNILSSYLHDYHPKASIYQEIAVMLGRVESPQLYEQATFILLDLLNNHGVTRQSVIIKQSIAMSLGQLRQPQAEATLVQLSQDEDARVKLHAIAALKTLRGEWSDRKMD